MLSRRSLVVEMRLGKYSAGEVVGWGEVPAPGKRKHISHQNIPCLIRRDCHAILLASKDKLGIDVVQMRSAPPSS